MKKLILNLPFGKWIYYQYTARKAKRSFVDSKKYWEVRYSSGGESGAGSRGRLADFKAETVNECITQLGIGSLADFGCGDGFIAVRLQVPQYCGFDISASAVSRCERLMAAQPHKSFAVFPPPEGFMADATLSMDVILHLVEDETFEAYMQELFRAARKWVIIYSADVEGEAIGWVRLRRFSDWVRRHAPHFELVQQVANPYPYDERDHDNTSPADFYIYQRAQG